MHSIVLYFDCVDNFQLKYAPINYLSTYNETISNGLVIRKLNVRYTG